MFSKEDAFRFVEGVLDISDAEAKLTSNKLNFLNSVTASVQHNIPFQNVSLLSLPKQDRHRPSLDDIRDAMLKRQGGLCYTQNVFMHFLLQSLGYDTALNSSTVTSTLTFPNNHIVVLVRNVIFADDLYLIDVGLGHPNFEAISLDFENESPIFKQSYLEFKYVKHEGKILRMHGDGDFRSKGPLPTDFFWGRFRRFYEFELAPTKKVDDFDSHFDNVYTRDDASPFHLSLRSIIFRNSRAVIVVNKRLLTENENGGFAETVLETDGELLGVFRSNFPTIPLETVRLALKNWRLTYEK